jgi:hypothetical protein
MHDPANYSWHSLHRSRPSSLQYSFGGGSTFGNVNPNLLRGPSRAAYAKMR